MALTKPRIIELLLVTTLPAMVLAAGGLPRWQTVLATLVGGTLAAGSANALNCYLDRDIDALMRRTGHRPLAQHDVSPTGALVFGTVLGVLAVALMGLTTNLLAAGLTAAAIAFYVRRLHAAAQAPDVAEHRLGRGGRLHAGADRLGGGHRLAGLGAGGAVRGGVLLDAAALLGAGDPLPRRLRPGRRADAAGGRLAGAGGPPDRGVLLG